MAFFETSALSGEAVEDMFISAAKDIYEGILTQKFDQDDKGEIVGVKEGNVQLTAAQRSLAIRQKRPL